MAKFGVVDDERTAGPPGHRAAHAVDLDTRALVGVTLQGADVGDTTSRIESAIMAAAQDEAL